MKRLLRAKKNIAGIVCSVTAGELVYGIRTGPCYTIFPQHKSGKSLTGIPASYLEELTDAVIDNDTANLIPR